MIKKLTLIILLNSFAINNLVAADSSKTVHEIFLIKSAWHVGILIRNNSQVETVIPVLNDFERFTLVDFGWGDEDFYQSESINYYYAVKAALIPTSSVIKVTGHYADLKSIVRWSDFAIKIELDKQHYSRLINFINQSFQFENGEVIRTSIKAEGAIKFYKSVHSYSLVYTCNTWVADALKNAGLDINPDEIITSEQLYFNAIVLGEVLK